MPCIVQIICVVVILLVFILVVVLSHTAVLVSRDEWNAKPAKLVDSIEGPVEYVIIHHSYQPSACWSKEACMEAMRNIQTFHQDDRGWNDIGYNFAVGGDGQIYEGRGFGVVGAHAPRYNTRSIGICLIGDWQIELPPDTMISAAKRLIHIAVDRGHVQTNYTLLGHRQTRPTECPGERLFREIQTWPHFVNLPVVLDVATTGGT